MRETRHYIDAYREAVEQAIDMDLLDAIDELLARPAVDCRDGRVFVDGQELRAEG